MILPQLLGWNIHQNDPYFITFLVATHLATALVLLGFFWRDWVRIVKGLGRSLRDREIARRRHRREARLAARRRHDPGRAARARCSSTSSAHVFASRAVRVDLPDAERPDALRRRAAAAPRAERDKDDDARIARTVGWRQAVAVGAVQAIALIPGFSRSGATMGGGLLVGLSNKDAARFAFLLATPIIGAAAVLKLPELFGSQGDGVRGQALVGAALLGGDRLPRGRFLMRFFETNTLSRSRSTACSRGSPARSTSLFDGEGSRHMRGVGLQ